MKKTALIAYGLLCGYTTISDAKITPIKLKAGIVSIADRAFLNVTAMHLIQQYKKRLNQFMRHKYTFNDTLHHSLPECVKLEDAHMLHEEHTQIFPSIIQEFISFSEHFLDYLQHIKNAVLPLIEEDCAQRNRENSLLLKWALIPIGDEQKLFKQEITSYRTLCTFCHDVLCFLEDLEYSCPEATKRYNKEIEYQKYVCHVINELLSADAITLSTDDYKKLLHMINEQKKHLNDEEITALYKDAIKTIYA